MTRENRIGHWVRIHTTREGQTTRVTNNVLLSQEAGDGLILFDEHGLIIEGCTIINTNKRTKRILFGLILTSIKQDILRLLGAVKIK